MLIVLCHEYLIMHVHIVQSDFVVRPIPFTGDRSPHTALPHLVEPPSACSLVSAHGVLCLGCPWPIGACSTVCAPCVFCVRCLCLRPSSCIVKGGIPSSRRYLPTYLFGHLLLVHRCAHPVCSWCSVHGPLALAHRCAHAVLCMRCPWQLGACSPVRAPGVLCVRCPWPLGDCSPACAPGVLRVRCPRPLRAC